jgi:LssY C-terminus
MKQACLEFLLCAAVFLLAGCAGFHPKPAAKTAFLQRAESETQGGVTVTVAVPDDKEDRDFFGVNLAKHDIQPVWLHIENHDASDCLFVPVDLDANYFSQEEVAWKYRFGVSAKGRRDMRNDFEDQRMQLLIPSGKMAEGFVFTHGDYGRKYVSIMLCEPTNTLMFEFVVKVPGLEADYERVDLKKIVPPETVRDVDRAELHRQLEKFPACVLGPDDKTPGDPLNIVVIGPPGGKLFLPFARRGWDVTETMSWGAIWRTIRSSLFGGRYRTSPVSGLYVFERKQDIALQKSRKSVNERNHLRLWLTPLRYEGREVWLGQISRDIGVRLTWKTLTTHKIDPRVDDAREYLVQDLLLSNGLEGFGYVDGVGVSDSDAPRRNYTGDEYYTDGLRAVLIIGEDFVPLDKLESLKWEWPTPKADAHGAGQH